MNTILHIETATKVCSVAISENSTIIDLVEFRDDNYSHSEKLNLLIIDLLNQNNLTFNDISAVAISEGPGSYTGLRIGTSTAKGICYGKDIPLISVNTLQALCEIAPIENGIKVPMIDARRMEVFTAFYSQKNELIKADHNLIVDLNSFDHYNEDLYLFGNGALKLKKLLSDKKHIHFIDDIHCTARGMIKIASEKLNNQDFVDLAYFEPNYGKEFYTTMKLTP